MEPSTTSEPTAKFLKRRNDREGRATHNDGSKSSRKAQEMKLDMMMDSDTAKPFRMLSAYFTTSAITSPP